MEEKDILLSEIRHYKEIVSQFMRLFNECRDFYVSPMIGISVLSRIVTAVVLYLIFGISIENKIIGFTLWLASIYFLFIWPTVHVKTRIKRNKDRIKLIQQKMQEIQASINPEYIPEVYINHYALTKLESYFVNKRADSLKEALNLFEQEKQHDEQMKEINIIQQIQTATYNKAEEAANLGWVNLFKK